MVIQNSVTFGITQQPIGQVGAYNPLGSSLIPKTLVLYLGQSNVKGDGHVDELPVEMQGAMDRVKMYNRYWDRFEDLVVDAQASGGNHNVGHGNFDRHGPEVPLSYYIANNLKQDVIFFKWGVGSTSLNTDWNSRTNGAQWADVISVLPSLLAKAKDEGYVLTQVIVYFGQGENDAVSSNNFSSSYATNIQNFVDDLYVELNSPNNFLFMMPTIRERTPRTTLDDYEIVNQAIKDLVKNDSRCRLINTQRLTLDDWDDNLHHDTANLLTICQEAYQVVADYFLGQNNWYHGAASWLGDYDLLTQKIIHQYAYNKDDLNIPTGLQLEALFTNDPSTITHTSGDMTAWADQSGNDHDAAVPTNGVNPNYVADNLGKPAVEYDGNNRGLVIDDSLDWTFLHDGTGGAVYVSVDADNVDMDSYGHVFSNSPVNIKPGVKFYLDDSSASGFSQRLHAVIGDGINSTLLTSDDDVIHNGEQVISYRLGDMYKVNIGGDVIKEQTVTDVSSLPPETKFALGCRTSPALNNTNDSFIATYYDWAIFASDIDDAADSQIAAYFADKNNHYHKDAEWIKEFPEVLQQIIHADRLNKPDAITMEGHLIEEVDPSKDWTYTLSGNDITDISGFSDGGGNHPELLQNAFGTLPAIEFTEANSDTLVKSGSSTATDISMFMAVRLDSRGNYRGPFSTSSGSLSSQISFFNNELVLETGSVLISNFNTALTHTFGMVRDNNDIDFVYNGTVTNIDTGSEYRTQLDTIRLFHNRAESTYQDGKLGYFVLFDTKLSPAASLAVAEWIKTRWNTDV